MVDDLISRRAAIDALWKALYEYEDKTEKQFIESEDLDFGDWITHRIFVQHMNDIDRQTILNLPSVERKKGEWINHRNDNGHNIADCSECGNALQWFDDDEKPKFCCMCGADMRGEQDG